MSEESPVVSPDPADKGPDQIYHPTYLPLPPKTPGD
jgi:hypothetical protein